MTVYADSQDLQMLFCCALRYALGRKSMSTHLIPEIIKDNVSMLDQKWFINYLEERGIVLSHFRNTEKYAVVFFDIGSATEWFELETIEFSEEKPRTEILEKLKEHGYPFADQYDENGKRKF